MSKKDAIQSLIDSLLPDTISENYLTEEKLKSNEETTLGVAISVWTEWDGLRIMRVFVEALEDANFHREAEEVDKWLKLLNKDDMKDYYEYFIKLEV